MDLPRAASASRAAAPSTQFASRVWMAGRFLAWTLIAILILYMTVGGGSGWLGIHSTQLRIFAITSIALVFGVWGLVAWRQPAWRPRSLMWPAIVAVLAAFVISTVFSWQPRLSLEYAAYAVLLAGLYLLLLRLIASDFFRPRLYGFSALLCAAICGWYLWTAFGIWREWWSIVGRIAIPPLRPALDGLSFGSPNAVAILAVLLLAPSLAFFWNGTRRRTMALGALTLLALLAILVSGSRGAWIGIAGALVIAGVEWLILPGHLDRLRGGWQRQRARRGALVVAIVATLAGSAVAAPLISSRLAGGGEGLRLTLVATAFRMFETAPLTGSGPGTWVARRIAFTEPGEIDYYIPHAHNVFAQGLAEFGLVGVFAAAVIVVLLVRKVLDGVRSPDARRRRFGWAGLFTVSYVAIHQMVDLFIGAPSVLFALGLSLGYLEVTDRRSIIRARWRPPAVGRELARIGRASLGIAVVGALLFSTWSESHALAADRSVGEANDGDWAQALASAREAARGDPSMPAYQFLVGISALHTGDLGVARDALRRSAEADGFPHAWINLAAALVDLGESDGARDALDEALRLGRQQPSVAFAAASLYLRLDDEASARDAFVAAIGLAPTLATDPYFASTPQLARIKPSIVAAISALRAPDDWAFALLMGNADDARRRAGQLTVADQSRPNLIIAAWDGDPAARVQLEASAKASPQDFRLVGWLARVARRAGDEAAAARYRAWANIVGPPSGAFGLDLRVAPVSGNTNVSGVDPTVYGLYTYRRPMPRDLLAPSVPHLALT